MSGKLSMSANSKSSKPANAVWVRVVVAARKGAEEMTFKRGDAAAKTA